MTEMLESQVSEMKPRLPRRTSGAKLKSERVEEMLKAMPDWSLSADGDAIQRTRKFPTTRVAALYAGYVADFASSWRQGANVTLSGRQVLVALPGAPRHNGCFGGLTEMVFVLARQLG